MTAANPPVLEGGTVREALKEVLDPELGLNIVDLGLIYDISIVGQRVFVSMTLTTPGCPLHASFATAVEGRIREVFPDVGQVEVELVFTPPWSADRISPAGREALGWR